MIHLTIGNLRLSIHQRNLPNVHPLHMLPPVAPSTGVTGSTTLFAAEAWDYCRRAAEFLEDLKNREVDQEGNPFTPLFLSFNLFD
jgi:hypothetical protein